MGHYYCDNVMLLSAINQIKQLILFVNIYNNTTTYYILVVMRIYYCYARKTIIIIIKIMIFIKMKSFSTLHGRSATINI